MWKKTLGEFVKVMLTLHSEHQRDLTDSAVMRDFPIILVNLQQQLNTLLREKDGVTFLERIQVDEESCQRNLKMSAHLVIAEPLYIALQLAGYKGDAHELVNHTLVPIAKQGVSLLNALKSEANKQGGDLQEAFEKIPLKIKKLLEHPENYTGDAEKKAFEIANSALQMVTDCDFE